MKKIVLSLMAAVVLCMTACSEHSPVTEICDIMGRMADYINKSNPTDQITPEDEAFFRRCNEMLDSIRIANEDLKLNYKDRERLKEASHNVGKAVVLQQAKARGMDPDSQELKEVIEQTEKATNEGIDNMQTLGDISGRY